MIFLGSQSLPTPVLSEDFDDTYEHLENDTIRSYNGLANFMENPDIHSIITVFAEKMVQNLICTDGTTDEGKQVIEVTLETFDVFVSSPASCRLICRCELIKQLLQNHVVSHHVQ